MPLWAVRRSSATAALLFFVVFLAVRESEAINTAPDVSSSTPAAVVLDFSPQNPEISNVTATLGTSIPGVFKTAVSYYYPMVLSCEYSSQTAGPKGNMILPGDRQLRGDMIFSVKISGDERFFIPGMDGVRADLVVKPGRLKETWSWPDGLFITREYFQSPQFIGTGIHFFISNQGSVPLNGLRLGVRLNSPEIIGNDQRRSKRENDDAMIADLRSAVLYQQDYLAREESWLGMGWSEEGGLITTGDSLNAGHELLAAYPDYLPDKIISLETPARDLYPGQSDKATFWIAWGNDRDTITRSFLRARKYSQYQVWEEAVSKHAAYGMKFFSRDPNLSFLFQMLKAWTPWMLRKDLYDRNYIASLENAAALSPGRVSAGIDGLIAFGQRDFIRKYLDAWLDERTESPAVAYTVVLARQYFILTHNKKWLMDNAIRLKELAYHLLEMDSNQDGLLEYNYYDDGFLSDKFSARNRRKTQYLNYEVAGLRAFSNLAELLLLLGDQECQDLAMKCQTRAQYGTKTLEAHFWRQPEPQRGYYAAWYFPPEGQIPYKSADEVEILLQHLATPARMDMIFEDLWRNPDWRTGRGYCRQYVNSDPDYSGNILLNQNTVNFAMNQALYLTGLLKPDLATDSVDKLTDYARQVVLDPEVLSMPGFGDSGVAAVDVSSLNLIQVITRGLCGLDPLPEGLRVTIPAYAQDLGIQIQDLPFRQAVLDVAIVGKGGGAGEILVNGKRRENGTVISNQELNSGRIVIQIKRFGTKKSHFSQN